MNETRLLPDDPRLTAYALGELTGDERAEVEAALRQNPALRVTVDEIRATAAQLEAALAAEAAETDAPATPARVNGHTFLRAQSEASMPASATSDFETKTYVGGHYAGARRGKLLRFPQIYYVVAGVAAACFAVLVAVHREEYA